MFTFNVGCMFYSVYCLYTHHWHNSSWIITDNGSSYHRYTSKSVHCFDQNYYGNVIKTKGILFIR